MTIASDSIPTTSKSSVPKVTPGGIQKKRASHGNGPNYDSQRSHLNTPFSGSVFIRISRQKSGFVQTKMHPNKLN